MQTKNMEKLFYVICYKHSSDGVLTFWRADNAGYTNDLRQAGKYTEAQINESPTYYNSGYWETKKRFVIDNIAVPCEEVENEFKIRLKVEKAADKYIEHTERIKDLIPNTK